MSTSTSPSPAEPTAGRSPDESPDPSLLTAFRDVRRTTEALTDGLAPEDFVVQSMEDVSPTKWHLAHTTWFFEAFVLEPHLAGYEALDPRYHYLFNSYYVQAGERHCRAQRGYLSRPTVEEVLAYRAHVDAAMETLLQRSGAAGAPAGLVTLGLNHEQQHQELMLTDLKHVFSVNPLRPVYRERPAPADRPALPAPAGWIGFDEGLREIGWGGEGFSYDNERPRHRTFLEPFELMGRLVTCGEFLEFMDDGGYGRPELWMSEGWASLEANEWSEPFYWERRDGEWWNFTLTGMRPVDASEPVCHVNWFEADAFARWAGARLPTEAEWEIAAAEAPIEGNLLESGALHPRPLPTGGADGNGTGDPRQMFGDVWEWTASPYAPYPGFRPEEGVLGEYNGKFMCSQYVLRGGSCATPRSHVRATYRNFFPPDASWQFTGFRLARDAG